MNGSPAAEAGAVAFEASLAGIERVVPVLSDIQTGFDQQLLRLLDRLLATCTNHPDQPLRQDAIESGYEVVRIDTHVQEAAQNIDDIVRMDTREDEVAR